MAVINEPQASVIPEPNGVAALKAQGVPVAVSALVLGDDYSTGKARKQRPAGITVKGDEVAPGTSITDIKEEMHYTKVAPISLLIPRCLVRCYSLILYARMPPSLKLFQHDKSTSRSRTYTGSGRKGYYGE
ncbi:hypothetical protein [Alcanivorax sp.]|uniref:hypothetical protein n=1 Tax=Alcanivorax sp. TaxID=1872427 RepID=UPI0032D97936